MNGISMEIRHQTVGKVSTSSQSWGSPNPGLTTNKHGLAIFDAFGFLDLTTKSITLSLSLPFRRSRQTSSGTDLKGPLGSLGQDQGSIQDLSIWQ